MDVMISTALGSRLKCKVDDRQAMTGIRQSAWEDLCIRCVQIQALRFRQVTIKRLASGIKTARLSPMNARDSWLSHWCQPLRNIVEYAVSVCFGLLTGNKTSLSSPCRMLREAQHY